MLYAFGALLLKRSSELGCGLWRAAFVLNLVTMLCYQPLWFFGGTIHLDKIWQPAVIAVCYLFGQVFSLVSLERGDVSVATPVLGVKIVLVAFFVTLLGGESVTMRFWLAAALSTAAIALLNRRPAQHHHHIGLTIITAFLSAAAFSLFDVLLRRWSPGWGIGTFLPLTLLMVGAASFAFIPFFHESLMKLEGAVWPWIVGGSLLFSIQSVMFVSTVAAFGNITAANILFSSRGLWSVALVWIVGHWFSSREQHLGRSILLWRLAGATLMMAAIALVVL